MNKKGIIAIVVIIILVILGFVIWGGKGSNTTVTNETGSQTATTTLPEGVSKDDYVPVTSASTDKSLIGRLKNASVSASETGSRVALVNGKASFTDGDVKGTVTLGDVAVSKTSAGTNYVLATLAVNSGGSGTFQYVVLFEDKNGQLTDKSYALIGDRVKITGVRADEVTGEKGAKSLVVTVSYLDRKAGEPLTATPSVSRTTILVVDNGEFNPAKQINL